MRHGNKGRKFGRTRDKRKAFFKSLAVNLIMKGKIKTTEARAKEIRRVVEPLITKAKKGDLSAIRILSKFLPNAAAHKLTKEIAPKYAQRQGGYTRISKLGRRNSDSAPIAIIELV